MEFAENLILKMMEDPHERDRKAREHIYNRKERCKKTKEMWSYPLRPYGFWTFDRFNAQIHYDAQISQAPAPSPNPKGELPFIAGRPEDGGIRFPFAGLENFQVVDYSQNLYLDEMNQTSLKSSNFDIIKILKRKGEKTEKKKTGLCCLPELISTWKLGSDCATNSRGIEERLKLILIRKLQFSLPVSCC
ncbi:hypothetical protein IEQ34_002397 [Dendrobium chrysotoxum]|uniref:Uncharacterized protein n=1 Tax=Dendrobium chrysotoxum TaxID=161865 RepID=A0AAV7HLZ2_DENCH|nr:hypothetical protein IEQ34_002397 [Dendrobium chrysotoxum]